MNIPPSLDKPGQLSECDRVKTHRIASVRVHVDRAIGRIKNYHICDWASKKGPSGHIKFDHFFKLC